MPASEKQEQKPRRRPPLLGCASLELTRLRMRPQRAARAGIATVRLELSSAPSQPQPAPDPGGRPAGAPADPRGPNRMGCSAGGAASDAGSGPGARPE